MKSKLFYWLSPVIGFILPTLIYYGLLWYYFQLEAVGGGAHPAVYLVSGLMFGMLTLIGLIGAYLYLGGVRLFPRTFIPSTIVLVGMVFLFSYFNGAEILGRKEDLVGKALWVAGSFIWISFCFIPVCLAAFKYFRKRRYFQISATTN